MWLGSFQLSGCPMTANLSFRHQDDIPYGTFFSADRPNSSVYIGRLDPIFEVSIKKNDCLMLFRRYAKKVNKPMYTTNGWEPCPARLVGKTTAFGLNETQVKREFTWRRFAIASIS
ncbi:hypothetical protein [Pseudomonas inefficax]|uniref:hypothetical protein n=1 Tax=Pseudomonas inefficax TaxID=2078786 RepID=UPI001063B061|nr:MULTISPECIES: hypothetical protein [Pseudomonas]MEC4560767.1 hypothetical protein [Pseudomonas sp. CMAA1741]